MALFGFNVEAELVHQSPLVLVLGITWASCSSHPCTPTPHTRTQTHTSSPTVYGIVLMH